MGFSLVQSAKADSSSSSTVTLAFGSNNTAGNLLVCYVGESNYDANPHTVTNVTDSAGNTWTKNAVTAVNSVGTTKCNTSGHYVGSCRSGANTVTVTLSASVSASIIIAEYSYTGTLSLDTTSTGGGSGTSQNTTAVSPTAGDLLVAFMAEDVTANETITLTSAGWTETATEQASANLPSEMAHKLSASGGSEQPTWTTAGTDNWSACLMAFKATGAGGGKLFLPANLCTGAGGPFFRNPIS